MEILTLYEPLFKTINLPPSIRPIITGRFISSLQPGATQIQLMLCESAGSSKYLLLQEARTQGVVLAAELVFDLKFEVLLSVQRNVHSHKLGIRLEDKAEHVLECYMSDAVLLQQWITALEKHINRKGFHESFKPLQRLGKGNFATVYEVQRNEDGRRFAVKAFSKDFVYKSKNGKQSLENELNILRALQHPNVLMLESVYESTNSIYVVMNLISGGQLYNRIISRNGEFTQAQIKQCIRQLLSASQHVHERRIAHRDLKPENIMMLNKVDMTPVIVDFGLATYVDQAKYLFTKCGTPGYVAPEIINMAPDGHIEPICDVFSIGVIFHIFLTAKPLFSGHNYEEVYRNNRNNAFNLNDPSYNAVPSLAMDLLRKTLEIDPLNRISAHDALNHPYFAI